MLQKILELKTSLSHPIVKNKKKCKTQKVKDTRARKARIIKRVPQVTGIQVVLLGARTPQAYQQAQEELEEEEQVVAGVEAIADQPETLPELDPINHITHQNQAAWQSTPE